MSEFASLLISIGLLALSSVDHVVLQITNFLHLMIEFEVHPSTDVT
jgi:hypothetical protein